MVARDIKDKAILAKLFVDIAPRFKTRPGGYTRMLKIGQRAGDASEMVILELVDEEMPEAGKSKKKSEKAAGATRSKAKAPKAAEKVADEQPAEESQEAEEASATAEESEAAAEQDSAAPADEDAPEDDAEEKEKGE